MDKVEHQMIKRLINKIRSYTCRLSNKRYVKYLRSKGIIVGGVRNSGHFILKLTLHVLAL